MKDVINVNEVQTLIMHQLYKHESLRFSEINSEDLPSDQFSYHLRQLIKYDLVQKTADGRYKLSVKGRSRAILLDTASSRFIEQGFVACRIILSRQHEGQKQYLIQRRTRVPYFGYFAEPGGKVLFGEDVVAAARRNMLTETGLRCDVAIRGLAHFKDNYQGEIVQDKFFFVIQATRPEGELLSEGPTGENLWMTLDEIQNNPKVHQGVVDMIIVAEGDGFRFIEDTHLITEY